MLLNLGTLRVELDVLASESWADTEPLDGGLYLTLFLCLSKK